ncbi:MAG: glycosyltransferase [Chloroflexi bacterium]|nr:glycosyltransferase [Chloroflexota bacterium]MBP8055456.1 glycosyltransferase [Chloroflexota bacterium]
MSARTILLLTPQLPYPPHQGTSLRNWHILRGLAQTHRVSLLSFVEPEQTLAAAALQPLLAVCQELRTVPVPQRSTAIRLRQLLTSSLPDMAHRLHHPAFVLALRQWLTETPFDIVQVEGIELARTIPVIRQISPDSRVLFDDHNAETELQRRNLLTDVRKPTRWFAAAYSFIQTYRLRRYEQWAMQQSDWVVAVSEQDAHLLRLLAPDNPITVIPNSLDTAHGYLALTGRPALPFDLLFTGKMDYRPNVDAVLWFAEAVWPQIRAARPQTTWAIVGQKPHERLNKLAQEPGITVTGWVESVQPYLAGAQLFLMPFRVGSGTRLKLIEAMAAGKAIVSTTVGAEGFPLQSGRELILADGATALAQAVLRLLADEGERGRLGAAAYQFAQQYDWRVVVPRFNALYEQYPKAT